MKLLGLSRSVVALSNVALGLAPAVAHAKPAKPVAELAAPRTAIEGSHYKLTVTIAKPSRASTVKLEMHDVAYYGEKNTTWTEVASTTVRSRSKVSFNLTAGDDREDFYRVVVSYAGIKGVRTSASKPVRVNLFHWYGGLYNPYHQAGSAISPASFSMTGVSWSGWTMAGGTSSTWDSTLVSYCAELKGTVGLNDDSANASTGTLKLSTIDPQDQIKTIHTSPTLIPGVPPSRSGWRGPTGSGSRPRTRRVRSQTAPPRPLRPLTRRSEDRASCATSTDRRGCRGARHRRWRSARHPRSDRDGLVVQRAPTFSGAGHQSDASDGPASGGTSDELEHGVECGFQGLGVALDLSQQQAAL